MTEHTNTRRDTTAETLRKWDAGDIVQTIELGGLGPGYEQAIQVLLMELLREGDASDEAAMRVIKRIPDEGYSGAQVGAARSLAGYVLEHGWASAFEQVEDDRCIMVSRHWPQALGVQP